MNTSRMSLMTVAAVLLLGCGAAFAQTCTPITSTPFTITGVGPYCLTANLSHTDPNAAAITVDKDGVVLDFSGYRLRWAGAGFPGDAAVKVLSGSVNVTIRNGLISEFDYQPGVETLGIGTIVEDMRLSNNGGGVVVAANAEGAIIRRNYVRNTNFVIHGKSARIVDNDLYGEVGLPFMAAITIDAGENALIQGNRIGRYYMGIEFIQGATGKYRDNITTNVTIPFSNGTNIGNNN